MISYTRGKRTFELDAHEFTQLKERLTGEELRRASKSGLRKSGKVLVGETERRFGRLVVKHKGKGKGSLTGLSHNGKRLPVATTKVFDKNKELQPMATVSIRNRRTDFRGQFFELGTAERKTRRAYKARRGLNNQKNGRYYPAGMSRGKIMEGRYFRRAQQASEQRVFDIMERTVNGHIVRMASKR